MAATSFSTSSSLVPMLRKVICLRLVLKILRKNDVEDAEEDNMAEVVVEDFEISTLS